MKTKCFFFMACCLCAMCVSCSHAEPTATEGEALISVMVKDFQFSKDSFVKGDSNEEASVKTGLADAFQCLTVVVYNSVSGEKVYEFNQKASQEDYGFFQFSLPYGKYNLIAVGYASNAGTFCQVKSLSEVDFCQAKVPEAFSASQNFEIVSVEAKSLTMSLERRVAGFTFSTTDSVPTHYTNAEMRMVIKGVGRLLNPLSGLATYTDSIVVNGTATAGFPLNKSCYCFLSEDACAVEVKVVISTTMNAILLQRTFQNVPLQRNHRTLASGQFFSKGSTLQISASTEWGSTLPFAY